MKDLTIKSLESKNNSVFISWENNLKDVLMMNVILDDDGSCTNMGIDPATSSATIPGLDSGKYLINVSALTPNGWVKSETLVVSV
jgi:hypothetical protein